MPGVPVNRHRGQPLTYCTLVTGVNVVNVVDQIGYVYHGRIIDLSQNDLLLLTKQSRGIIFSPIGMGGNLYIIKGEVLTKIGTLGVNHLRQ